MSQSSEGLDALSKPAREVLKLDVADAYTRLVAPSSGNPGARPLLDSLNPDNVLSKPAHSRSDAAAMLAGLWLWQDWLSESHQISQSLATSTGSFWHAIMHRREGDFGNSKYWYSRCSDHPAIATLTAAAADVINPFPADKSALKLLHPGWNSTAFVDFIQSVHDRRDDPRHSLAVALQQLEWRILFDHCSRAAAGR
jgi:hypothetical protein